VESSLGYVVRPCLKKNVETDILGDCKYGIEVRYKNSRLNFTIFFLDYLDLTVYHANQLYLLIWINEYGYTVKRLDFNTFSPLISAQLNIYFLLSES
jgi:hypothetical protein